MPSTEMISEELLQADDAAETLLSEKFCVYLPGRMLPMLLGRFRDDMAEALGRELPPLPRRPGPVGAAKLDDLTSGELDTLSGAVMVLADPVHSAHGRPAVAGTAKRAPRCPGGREGRPGADRR